MLSVRRVGSALEVTGSLDDEGGRTLLSALDSWSGDVQVDAAGINRVDGAGLTALALARFRCRADGRAFALTRLSPDAVRTLRARDDVLVLFGRAPAAPAPDAEAHVGATATGPATRPAARATRRPRWAGFHRFSRRRHDGHRHDGM